MNTYRVTCKNGWNCDYYGTDMQMALNIHDSLNGSPRNEVVKARLLTEAGLALVTQEAPK